MPDDPHKMQCMEVWGGNEPTERTVSLGGLDAWVTAVPHASAAAGGDVHYLSSCATGRITRMFLADVSGHGEHVAEIGRALRTLMREHVNHLDQRHFVARMNEAFVKQSSAGTFATALVCTYFAPTGELSICNAGHPPPLLYRASTKQWQVLDDDHDDRDQPFAASPAGNIPLGILDVASYEQFRITLADGDRVLCYTDSLIEARSEDGEPLGPEGVCAIANNLSADGLIDGVITSLLAAIIEKSAQTLHDDDVTALLFTPNTSTAHVNLATRLTAPLRIIRCIFGPRGERCLPMPELSIANLGGAILGPLSRFRRK